MLAGEALRFNERAAFPVEIGPEFRREVKTECERAYVTYRPGCLDRSLRAAKREPFDNRIVFLLQHDFEFGNLCSTASGSLQLSVTNDGLGVFISNESKSGRYALRIAAALGHRELSVGGVPTKLLWGENDGVGEAIVEELRLIEISLVAHGANSGVWCGLIY
jgi:phage head maturation protease